LAGALLGACLHAQQHSPSTSDAAQQQAAKQLAAKVDRHYNQLHSLKAGFEESYQGLGMHRAESGTLLLQKPGMMKWEYSTPKGKQFVVDGKFAWFYSSGDPQVQRMPAKELDDLHSPLRFLLGHTELAQELSNLEVAQGSGGSFILSGRPRGQEKRVARISLTVAADGAISEMEIEEMDGALTRFTFSSQEPNVAIPSSTFHFTPPAGVPVVNAAPPV
jgi:outer membrane lipoprotein carrier protein